MLEFSLQKIKGYFIHSSKLGPGNVSNDQPHLSATTETIIQSIHPFIYDRQCIAWNSDFTMNSQTVGFHLNFVSHRIYWQTNNKI